MTHTPSSGSLTLSLTYKSKFFVIRFAPHVYKNILKSNLMFDCTLVADVLRQILQFFCTNHVTDSGTVNKSNLEFVLKKDKNVLAYILITMFAISADILH